MGFVTSLVLAVGGALLRVTAAPEVAGFKAHAAGVVLMVVGGLSAAFFARNGLQRHAKAAPSPV
jgi:hypothetical protein